jgi:hypothetical protein
MRSAVCRLEILATRALAIADELRGESGPARMLAAARTGARMVAAAIMTFAGVVPDDAAARH